MAFVFAHGQMVAQRYRLDRLLGEGGMGAVWAATHQVTRKPVALKFLKGVGASRPDVRRRFLREARAASAVRHPNVVQIHDIFEIEDGEPVMVMDLLVGESLGSRLKREFRLSPSELATLLVPVVSAVGTAHAVGIVHRDLKPDNIFIVQIPGGAEDVRVLDFGIAKLTATEGDAAQTGGITQTGDMLGTPYYMAPEQISGESDIDHRADIWGLGVIVYECLTGERPIQGSNIGQILKKIITGAIVPLGEAAPHLPKDLTDMVTAMMAHDRAARPSDLRDVQAVLMRYTGVDAQSFGGARALSPQPDAPTPDPYGSTTPGGGKVELPVPSPVMNGDPRWRAATQSFDSASPPPSQPASATRPRSSLLPIWIGGGFALLVALGLLAQWLLRDPAPALPAPTAVVQPAPAPAAPEVPAATPVAAPVVAPVEKPPAAALPAEPAGAKKPAKHRDKREPIVRPVANPVPRPAVPEPETRLPGGVPEKPPY